MNTSRHSSRCLKNSSSHQSFMLPTSIYVLSKSRQMKDLTNASKSQARITIKFQKIYPVSNGEANQVSQRASSGLVDDDDSKVSQEPSFNKSTVAIQRILVKPVLKNDHKVVRDGDSIGTGSRKRVYPFEILLAVGKEVSKKQRLSKGMEMEENHKHEKAASNETKEENSRESDQDAYSKKMQREKERETARIALETMERTVVIYDNHKSAHELEALAGGHPMNLFQTLGLVLKREYRCEEDEEEEEEDILNVNTQAATTSLSPEQNDLRATKQKKNDLRVEMLLKRFADTILKAKQTMEEKQQENGTAEVSSVAGVAVAESKKSQAANSTKYEERPKLKLQHNELNIHRKKERETCRIAVQTIISKKKKDIDV